MNLPNDPKLSPDGVPAPGSVSASPSPGGTTLAAEPPQSSRRLPRDTALRRRRLQLARYLRAVAQLREQATELQAEISSLESIIGAQANAIDALRRQKSDPDD